MPYTPITTPTYLLQTSRFYLLIFVLSGIFYIYVFPLHSLATRFLYSRWPPSILKDRETKIIFVKIVKEIKVDHEDRTGKKIQADLKSMGVTNCYCYDSLTDRRVVQWKQNTDTNEVTNY